MWYGSSGGRKRPWTSTLCLKSIWPLWTRSYLHMHNLEVRCILTLCCSGPSIFDTRQHKNACSRSVVFWHFVVPDLVKVTPAHKHTHTHTHTQKKKNVLEVWSNALSDTVWSWCNKSTCLKSLIIWRLWNSYKCACAWLQLRDRL